MLNWIESRIDPFMRRDIVRPPEMLRSFYWHFISPVWPVFALVLLFDLLAALSEVALAKFVADLIDVLQATATPARLFTDHAGLLLWMAFVVLLARPIV